MRIFKPLCKQRDGTKRRTQKFYLEFSDHWSITHRLADFTDEQATAQLGRNIMEFVRCRAVGMEMDVKLHQWLETVSDSLLKKLIAWGIVDGQRGEVGKLLLEHIADWQAVLKARGLSKDYVTKGPNRAREIVKKCRFLYFRDITRSKVETFAGTLRGQYTDTTRKHYLDAITTFLNWAVEDERIIKSPLDRLAKPDRDDEERGVLTPEQFMHLLKTTHEQNVRVLRSSGTERAVLYLLAGSTGLRRLELLLLTWGNVQLSDHDAFVRVPAKLAKNSKTALQPVTAATVSILQALKAEQEPKRTDRVFSCLGTWVNTKDLITGDMERADIPPTDRDGNEISFHSLRNSYISFLANSRTPPKTIQKLARHSDPKLTFNVYGRSFEENEKNAIKQLPDMTDFAGQFCLASCCPSLGDQHRPLMTSSVKKSGQDIQKNAVLASQKIAPRGFEPLLPG